MSDELERLRAEVERLKAALDGIAYGRLAGCRRQAGETMKDFLENGEC